MLIAIPYHTFPEFHIGPLPVRTFGLAVAFGCLAGTWVAAGYAERGGIPRGMVNTLAMRLVVAGLVGARIAWVLTHLSDVHSPLDPIAVWKGGLTFSGGFVLAVAVGVPSLRRLVPDDRWRLADGMILGLTVGLAIGRIGCYSVGEHLGGTTSFFLGVRYLGGATREGPLVVGQTYHNTALYEFLHLLALAGILWWLLFRRRRVPAGFGLGLFCVWYGIARFTTDTLRAYDTRVLGLTAAQWMCVALVPAGAWILARARGRTAHATGLADSSSTADLGVRR